MANLLSLPTELILEIFSHLGDSCWPPNPPNSWFGIMPSYPKGELFNIALVCRRLASIATPLIYREIVLYDPSLSFNAEKLFWSFKENPILRSYVRVIFFSERPFEEFGDDSELAKFFHFPNAVEVIVNHDGCDGVEHDDCLWGGNKGEYYVWTNRFPILLSSCPQLSKLVLLIEGVGDWDCQKTEILLSKLEPHASTLTELSVRYAKGMGRGRPNRSSPIWHPLTHGLCKFSAVQRIQVDWSFFLPYELLWDERLPICKPHTKVPSNIRTLEVLLPSHKGVFAREITPENPSFIEPFQLVQQGRWPYPHGKLASIDEASDMLIYGNFATWLLDFADKQPEFLPRLREIIFSGDDGNVRSGDDEWEEFPSDGWLPLVEVAAELRTTNIQVKLDVGDAYEVFSRKSVGPLEYLLQFWQTIDGF